MLLTHQPGVITLAIHEISGLEINKLLNKIHVKTAGGAGKIFPDGLNIFII